MRMRWMILNTMDRELKKYYSEISKHMVCKRKDKHRLISDIKNNISSYIKENPDCTYQEIIEHYGTPEEIWASHLESLDAKYIKSSVKTSKFIKITISIIVCFILLGVLVLFIDRQINKPTVIEERIEIGPEEELE